MADKADGPKLKGLKETPVIAALLASLTLKSATKPKEPEPPAEAKSAPVTEAGLVGVFHESTPAASAAISLDSHGIVPPPPGPTPLGRFTVGELFALPLLMRESTGRYLNPKERQALLEFAAGLPHRLQVAEQVERVEDSVVRSALAETRLRYPRFEQYHDGAWAKCYRDAQLVVRHAVQAMLFADPAVLEDRLLHWLRSVGAAANLTPQFIRGFYSAVRDELRDQLPADGFAMIEPWLTRAVEFLSDIPEPSAAAV